MVRSRLSRLLLAPMILTSAMFVSPSHAATTIQMDWPVFANIVVNGNGGDQMPEFRVESFAPELGATLDVTAEWNCAPSFFPQQKFDVSCYPISEPEDIVWGEGEGQVTVDRTWACDNPQVHANINGPVQGESVTGTVQCERSQATCTAAATSGNPLSGYSGSCAAFGPPSRVPLRCFANLTNVRYDNWQVTCYGTDP